MPEIIMWTQPWQHTGIMLLQDCKEGKRMNTKLVKIEDTKQGARRTDGRRYRS